MATEHEQACRHGGRHETPQQGDAAHVVTVAVLAVLYRVALRLLRHCKRRSTAGWSAGAVDVGGAQVAERERTGNVRMRLM